MKKRKYIVVLLLVTFVIMFFAAGCVEATDTIKQDRFVLESKQSLDVNKVVYVIKDKMTGVHYMYINDYKAGGLCVITDAKGNPLVK